MMVHVMVVGDRDNGTECDIVDDTIGVLVVMIMPQWHADIMVGIDDNRHFPNLLECSRNNSMKSRRAMIPIVTWRVSLSPSFSHFCVMCTEANSVSVY